MLATGETHSVREFVELAFADVGTHASTGAARASTRSGYRRQDRQRCLVEVDPRYFRPTEVDLLLGDADARRATKLGWRHKTTFASLVAEMVDERPRGMAGA